MESIYIILYVFLGIQIIVVEFSRKKNKKFDFFSGANFFFLLAYVITPIYYGIWSQYNLYIYIDNSDQILFYSIFAYQLLWIGWSFGTYLKPSKSISQTNINWVKFTINWFWVILILFSIIIIEKGGISKAIGAGAISRYNFEELETGTFAFLSRIVALSPFLTAVFFFYLIKQDLNYDKTKIKWYYFSSLIISILLTFISASRGGLARIFVLQFLIFILVKRKIKITNMLAISFALLIVIAYGKHFFYAVSSFFFYGNSFTESFNYMEEIRGTEEEGYLEVIFSEFAHPIKSLNVAIEYNNSMHTFTYFRDFFWSVLRIFPQRITSFFVSRPETVTTINTHLLTNNMSTSIPPGIIGTFFYSFGGFGIAIGMFLYGLVGGLVNNNLIFNENKNKAFVVPFVFFTFFYGFFIVNGDPNVYIYYILMPIVYLIILSKSTKIKFKSL